MVGAREARHRAIRSRAFLDEVEGAVPTGLDVHLVLDDLKTHKTRLVRDRLAGRPRWRLHLTPTIASWLDLVERRFAPRGRRRLARGAFTGTDGLEAAILAHTAEANAAPRPFVWTKTAFEHLIIDSAIVRAHRHAAGAKGDLRLGQALGRSRGGPTSKPHLAVRGLGGPARILLTAGRAGDAPRAHRPLEGRAAEIVIADTACDADHLREAVAAKSATAIIPSSPSRARRLPLDGHLHKERHLVECCIGKLKHFRRVAARDERTARDYLAVVTAAATILRLRYCPRTT